jgi:hypothetical protein
MCCHNLIFSYTCNFDPFFFKLSFTREQRRAVQLASYFHYTGRFIMFSVVANIYKKKAKGPTLMEFFTATGKMIFFIQLETFDVCTTGDTAYIDTIFKLLPHTGGKGFVRCPRGCTQRTSLVVKKKKNFFCFPVAVNNSVKVGPLVFLL